MNSQDKIKVVISNDNVINSIKPFIKDTEVFLVGGYLRNVLSNKESNDRDLVVLNIPAEKLAKQLSDKLNGYFVPLDTENQIYRIVLQDKINYIDIAQAYNNSIEEDISRRDLSVNSIFYDLNNDIIIDKYNGIADIENRIIRGIQDKNFIDDPLRLLRIFRFASMTGFKIDNSLEKIVKENYKLINTCASERINLEFMKLLEGDFAFQTLYKMNDLLLFDEILPEFADVKTIPENSHHHLKLFEHLLETVNQIEKLYKNADSKVQAHFNETLYGKYTRLAHLKLAGIFHDIGKPEVWTIEEDTGRHRFIKHDEIGSKLAPPILKRLKFSNKQILYICKMIKYHIYPSSLVGQNLKDKKAYLRFFRKIENESVDLIYLAMADRLSARGKAITEKMVEDNISGLNNLLDFYYENQTEIEPPEKLLTGDEIKEITGLQQSKELGDIVKATYNAQLDGILQTKDEAITFVKKQLMKN